MYILKNAVTSIRRNKGRNILIGIILIVIAISCTITLAIRSSATNIVTAYEKKNPIEATIEMNRETLMSYLRDGNKSQEEMINAFNELNGVTEEEINTYGDSSYVKNYYYTYSLGVDAKNLTEATDSLVKETENDILDIFVRLAHEDNKCVIIVTHSENVCNKSDIIYELKKQ